jgi:hypothetical protein
MRYLLIVLIFSVFMELLSAREPITGTVLDAETRQPLPFTNIVVEGKNMGTVSNIEGYFVLDKDGISPNDVIVFSYVGYKVVKMPVVDLLAGEKTIYLSPATVTIGNVNVSSKSLSAEQILRRVRKNYDENHPNLMHKQNIFFHKYEKTPFPESNKIVVKSSDFVGLDKKIFDEIRQSMPHEFTEYQDVIMQLYSYNKEHKIIPKKGISLEEGTNQALFEEMENKLGVLFEDIDKSNQNKKLYYQFKSGILRYRTKNKKNNGVVWEENQKDKLNYAVKTEEVKSGIATLLKDYSNPKGKNWEFINSPGKYYYTKDEITVFGDDIVYAISFKPKRKGLFKGTMYISTTTFAVLQLNFEFAPGKRSERFQMLGFGHSMNFKKGHVIFEKTEEGYFVKYIYAQQYETARIDRNLSIKKKQRRFFNDKELNTIKLEVNMAFDMKSNWELLVLNRQKITQNDFDKAKEPILMKFKKEYAYSPEKWENRTVIAPISELKKYKRK